MTQPNQPLFSGAPQPVNGVTGGPAVLGGQIGNDPNTGNITLTPNPGNSVEIKKSPSAFNVYEYFNSSTDNARIALETALGGPEFIGVRAAPGSVVRNLNIGTPGIINLQATALQLNGSPLQYTLVQRFFIAATTANPATTSTSYVGMPDMNISVNSPVVTDCLVSLDATLISTAVGNQALVGLQMDAGTVFAVMLFQTQVAGPNNALPIHTQWYFPNVPAGAHTFHGVWAVQSGTLTRASTQSYMSVLQYSQP